MSQACTFAELYENSQNLVKRLEDLDAHCTQLLSDAEKIDSSMQSLLEYRQEEVYKAICARESNTDNLDILTENAELKVTVEEYEQGVHAIMENYKEHCNSDILAQGYKLREKYLNGLNFTVGNLDERINKMIEVMQIAVDVEDECENRNRSLICSLAAENDKLRRQLQITTDINETARDSDMKEIQDKEDNAGDNADLAGAAKPIKILKTNSATEMKSNDKKAKAPIDQAAPNKNLRKIISKQGNKPVKKTTKKNVTPRSQTALKKL